jgi:hypothetical protein
MAQKLAEMFSKALNDKEIQTFGGSTGELTSRFIIFKVNDRPRIPTASKRRTTSTAI